MNGRLLSRLYRASQELTRPLHSFENVVYKLKYSTINNITLQYVIHFSISLPFKKRMLLEAPNTKNKVYDEKNRFLLSAIEQCDILP